MSVLELPGNRYRYFQTEYWAEQGMVHVIDERDPNPQVRSIAPKDFIMRAHAFRDICKLENYPGDRLALENASHNMEKVALEAIAQGDPTDPDVHEFWARHGYFKKKYVAVNNAFPSSRMGDVISK